MENCFSEGQLHNIDSVVIVIGAVKCIAGCGIMLCISDVEGAIPNATAKQYLLQSKGTNYFI